VRGGRQADDTDGGLGIAEAGEGLRPVPLAAVAAGRVGGHLLAPIDQARAAPAGDDLVGETLKVLGRRLRARAFSAAQ
jgi:hypothetical protein